MRTLNACNFLLFFFSCLVVFISAQARAQNITVTQDLSFGRFIVSNNASVQTIVIPANESGSPSYSSGIIPIEDGHPAICDFDSLPVSPASVTVNEFTGSTVMSDGGAGPNFTISNYTTSTPNTPTPITVNPDGTARVVIGATLATTGLSDTYQGGQYTTSYSITIDY